MNNFIKYHNLCKIFKVNVKNIHGLLLATYVTVASSCEAEKPWSKHNIVSFNITAESR